MTLLKIRKSNIKKRMKYKMIEQIRKRRRKNKKNERMRKFRNLIKPSNCTHLKKDNRAH